jgi:hypothetical protein
MRTVVIVSQLFNSKQTKSSMQKNNKVASKKTGAKGKTMPTTATSTPKAIVHNRKFPVVRASRTEMVNVINSTKGRFFTSTHIDKDGTPRTMNVIKSNKPATELGYILVYSLQDKGYRNLNPQTLTDVSFKGTHYTAKTKPRLPKTV